MDNLLKAIDTLSLKKAKGCHMDWLSRGANLPQIGLDSRFQCTPKSDRLGTEIGDRVRPESVISLGRNTHTRDAVYFDLAASELAA